MATYLIVNIIFILVVIVILRIKFRMPSSTILLVLTGLLIMTAVFDSLIVGMGIVGYNKDLLLGMYIGNAPIEDFFYAVLAIIIVPTLWNKMEKKNG